MLFSSIPPCRGFSYHDTNISQQLLADFQRLQLGRHCDPRTSGVHSTSPFQVKRPVSAPQVHVELAGIQVPIGEEDLPGRRQHDVIETDDVKAQ